MATMSWKQFKKGKKVTTTYGSTKTPSKKSSSKKSSSKKSSSKKTIVVFNSSGKIIQSNDPSRPVGTIDSSKIRVSVVKKVVPKPVIIKEVIPKSKVIKNKVSTPIKSTTKLKSYVDPFGVVRREGGTGFDIKDFNFASSQGRISANKKIPTIINQPKVSVVEKPVFTLGTALRLLGKVPEKKSDVKLLTNSSGKVIGVQDPVKKMSYKLDRPVEKKKIEKIFVEKQLEKEENIRRRAVKSISKVKDIEKVTGMISAVEKKKGFKGIVQTVDQWKELNINSRERANKQNRFVEAQMRGLFVSAGIGALKGVTGVVSVGLNPFQTFKGFISSVRHPVQTVKGMGSEFVRDPVSVIAEYYVFGKTAKVIGKGVKSNPISRVILEEKFIISQPKAFRPYVRAIIKSSKVQEKLFPAKMRKKVNVDFIDVKTLGKIEAQALKKTLQETNSVVFGSKASRVLSKGKTKVPHDVDLATANIKTFNKKFMQNLPKKLRSEYVLKGEKILTKKGQPVLDVKPFSRLIPDRSIFTRRGKLPVQRIGKEFKATRFTTADSKIFSKRVGKTIKELKIQSKGANPKLKTTLNKAIKKLQKERSFVNSNKIKSESVQRILETRLSVGSEIAPRLRSTLKMSDLQIPTQKPVKVGGIKFTSFGEQTARKGLGSLQALLEKNTRRAKDPSAFIESIKIQRNALKRIKPKTKLGKVRNNAKIKKLNSALKVLESKEFEALLRKRVGSALDEFPLLKKINPNKLKKAKLTLKSKKVTRTAKKVPKRKIPKKRLSRTKVTKKVKKRVIKKKKPSKVTRKKVKKTSRLPKKKPSRLPSRVPKSKRSRLPKSKRSKLPSKLPKKKISRLPSKVPSRPPSKPPKRVPSKLPPPKVIRRKKIPNWNSKLPKGKVLLVVGRYKKGKKIITTRQKLTPNRATRKMNTLVDNNIVASYDLKIVGVTKGKDIQRQSMKKFTVRKGRDPKVRIHVERARYRLDRPNEKKQLRKSKRRR